MLNALSAATPPPIYPCLEQMPLRLPLTLPASSSMWVNRYKLCAGRCRVFVRRRRWLQSWGVLLNSANSTSPAMTTTSLWFDADFFSHAALLLSVLSRCWLGGRKGIRPVKNWMVGCWRGYLSGARCRLAYGPVDATATHCHLLQ